MSRSLFYPLALTIALAAGTSVANAAGYDSGWQERTTYSLTRTVNYDDGSYVAPRVIHRVRGYSPWGYTVRRRAVAEPCH